MNKGYLLSHSLLAQPQFKQWPCLSAATYCAGSNSFRALDLSEFCRSFPTPLSFGLNSSLLLLLLRCLTVVGRITALILKNPVNVLMLCSKGEFRLEVGCNLWFAAHYCPLVVTSFG